MSSWKQLLPAHGRAAGLVAVAVVWLLAFQIWWVAPRRTVVEDRQAALARMRTELTRLRQEADRLPAVEAGIADLETRLAEELTARADARDTAALLRRIESLADAATLSMRGYTPEAALVYELHSEWPSRLELSGGYEDLRLFFDRIDGCVGEVAIGNLALRATDAADDGATVSAAFTVTAFAFNGAARDSTGWTPDAACSPDRGAPNAAPDERETHADPFAPLPSGGDALAIGTRVPGLPGLRVGELTLQGLVSSAGRPLAVVAAPGGEIYILHGGERLLDGSVAAVQANAVVFLERAGGSGVAREIRRTLVYQADRR